MPKYNTCSSKTLCMSLFHSLQTLNWNPKTCPCTGLNFLSSKILPQSMVGQEGFFSLSNACWGSYCTPDVPDALTVEDRVDGQHRNVLQPLDKCRKMARSRQDLNLRPRAHYFQALTTPPSPPQLCQDLFLWSALPFQAATNIWPSVREEVVKKSVERNVIWISLRKVFQCDKMFQNPTKHTTQCNFQQVLGDLIV